MKSFSNLVFILSILFVCFFQTSCEKDQILLSSEDKKQLVTLLPALPDPTNQEIMIALEHDGSSKLKSGTAINSVETQRLDSNYFVSGMARRYFVRFSDEYQTEIKSGYMIQTFTDIQEGVYHITFSWGLSESDGISKVVKVTNNFNEEKGVLEFSSLQGITLLRESNINNGTILLPPIMFNVAAEVGKWGCSTSLFASNKELLLEVELTSNTIAIIQVPIPTDQQLFAGKYWFDVRGSGENHIQRSYSTLPGQKFVKVYLPFIPTSISMEQKLLKNAMWEEMGLYTGTGFKLLSKSGGVSLFETTLALL